MISSTSKYNQRKTAAVILLVLLLGIFGNRVTAGESDETIMVNNVWVDVPLGQIFRDVSIETGVIIATCPHIPDPLISLDAGFGKPLSKCLDELIAGQGLFVWTQGTPEIGSSLLRDK